MKPLETINALLRRILQREPEAPGAIPQRSTEVFISSRKKAALDRLSSLKVEAKPEGRTQAPAVLRQQGDFSKEIDFACAVNPLLGMLRRRLDLAIHANLQTQSAYALLYRNNDPGEDLYFVIQGTFRLFHYNAFEEEVLIDESGPGSALSLTSLLSGKRTHFALSTEPAQVLSVPRQLFLEVMGRHASFKQAIGAQYRQALVLERVADAGIFTSMPLQARKALCGSFTVSFHKAQEYLLTENQGTPRSLSIIARGTADVFRTVHGSRILLNRLYEGDFFGEMSLLSGTPPSASVVANEACEILNLPAKSIFALLDEYPAVRENLLKVRNDRLLLDKALLAQAKPDLDRKADPKDSPKLALPPPQKIDFSQLPLSPLLRMVEHDGELPDEQRRVLAEAAKRQSIRIEQKQDHLKLDDILSVPLSDLLERTYAKAREELEVTLSGGGKEPAEQVNIPSLADFGEEMGDSLPINAQQPKDEEQ